MDRDSEAPSNPGGLLTPAPYGRACAGCARAKNKCYYRSDVPECERCHRLGKACEPSSAVRKRKAKEAPSHPPPPSKTSSRLEERLDDLVSLLRSQAADRQAEKQFQAPQGPQPTPSTLFCESTTPSSSTLTAPTSHGQSVPSTPAKDPDLLINTAPNIVDLARPANGDSEPSPVLFDVSLHEVPDNVAESQLNRFRNDFIPIFPFIHIPAEMKAAELRRQKPFLWLVIMASTTTIISQQFAMEETIWHVISKRIIAQHLANLDLLLGLISFTSWSHYFKQDKPFMSMLSQVAVSLAAELGIDKDVPSVKSRYSRKQLRAQNPPVARPRTLEERRTMLAVFHLTSSTWTVYRKTEPLRWTPYLDSCINVLDEAKETEMDVLLSVQVKCHILTNQLIYLYMEEPANGESPNDLPAVLMPALLGRLNDIQKGLPTSVSSTRTVQFYVSNAEVTILESSLSRPTPQQDPTGAAQLRRLQDLNSLLNCSERWTSLFLEMPLKQWVGVNVDTFSQFTHNLVVLCRLQTADEPGWDREEVRRRADVVEILNRTKKRMESIPIEMGMVDADGPRSGLFFKTSYFLDAIKNLFLRELGFNLSQTVVQSNDSSGHVSTDAEAGGDLFSEDPVFDLSMEPWLSDILSLSPGWEFGADEAFDTEFAA